MQQNQRAPSDKGPGADSGAISVSSSQATFSSHHLETLTELALARFPTQEAEDARIAEIRPVLDAAYALRQRLEIHTHYLLVDHRGTPGLNDLNSAARELLTSLAAYACSLRNLADRYENSAHRNRIQIYRGAAESDDLPGASPRASDAS